MYTLCLTRTCDDPKTAIMFEKRHYVWKTSLCSVCRSWLRSIVSACALVNTVHFSLSSHILKNVTSCNVWPFGRTDGPISSHAPYFMILPSRDAEVFELNFYLLLCVKHFRFVFMTFMLEYISNVMIDMGVLKVLCRALQSKCVFSVCAIEVHLSWASCQYVTLFVAVLDSVCNW